VPSPARPGAGLALAVLSAATFGTSGTVGTSLIDAGWTAGSAVTVRVAIAALVLTPFAVAQLRGRWALLARSGRTVSAYGVLAVAGAQLCYFNALSHLSVGVALLLEYLGTILIVGWLWLRRGQRPRRLTVAGGSTAVLGLAFVLDLTGTRRLDPVGVLWGLGAAVGLAVYFLVSAHTVEALPPLVLAWSGLAVGAIALGVLGLAGFITDRAPRVDVHLAGHPVSWVVPVLWLSLVAAVVAYVAGIGAARLLGPKVSSFVGLTEVLFAVLFAWAVLGQAPGGWQLVGGVLILTGVALVRVDELRSPTAAPSR
jgi:drug/metabolite transporter (DMT)-like permease